MKVLNADNLANHYDLIVVGSGAGGLTAAATAAHAGLSVLVLEKAELLGGTSAVSGGMLWVVDNHYAREAGFADSKQAGREYVEAVARGRGRAELLDAALLHGSDMLEFIEDELDVKFLFLDNFPDYRQDLPGAVHGGRTIEPQLFNYREALGKLADYVRTDAGIRTRCRNMKLGVHSPSSRGTNLISAWRMVSQPKAMHWLQC